MRNRQHHKLIRALAFFLAVLLLLSGCVGPNGTTEPGKTTEPGQTTDQPSSEQGTDTPSEVIIRTLADQQSEWTEGQYYPGAYEKGTMNFSYPKGFVTNSVTDVLDVDGVIYAYWNLVNANGVWLQHMIRRISGLKEEDFACTEIPDNYKLSGMAVGADLIYLLTRPEGIATETTTHETELFIYSVKGEFRLQAKLADLLESDQVVDTSVTACTDQSGALWIRLPEAQAFYCVESDGKVRKELPIPEEFQGTAMRGRNTDELLGGLKTENGLRLSKMNTESGSVEAFVIEGLPRVQYIFPGTTYDALVATEKSAYGVTLGETVEIRELLAFSDLGIDGAILKNIEDHEGGSLSILLMGRTKTEGERIALKPRTTKVREGLVLACLKENDYIRYAVDQYNNEHPDNKITIKEYFDKYAVDTSETDALNRLNSDLMDGTAGDIVCLDGISFAGGGKALLEKGVFLDLYELMDNDPEFNKEDYFTDIFRVNETDGKLYRLVPFFSLNTKYGKVDDVGETTHIDESILFETEPLTSLYGFTYNRTQFIHDLLVFSLGDFRDQDAALYDIPQLTRYIETAGKLSGYDPSDTYDHLPEEYIEALEHLYKGYLLGNIRFFNRWYWTEDGYFRVLREASAVFDEPYAFGMRFESEEGITKYLQSIGARITYSGFPVKEGCGSAVINKFTLSIPSATDAREEAWAFLKCTLAEAYQSQEDIPYYAIPVNRNAFQHLVEKQIEYQDESVDPCRSQVIGDISTLYEERRALWRYPALQQWMVDAFMNLLPEITKVDEVDANVEAIVTEEIDKYCDGRQTAEEAARNIAERVELYRDEQ